MRLWLVLAAVLAQAACGPEMTWEEEPDAPPPPPPGAPDAGSSNTMMYPDAPECAQSVPIEIVENITPPDVLLVVDKSGSMRERLNSSSPQKWQLMRDALNAIVMANDTTIYYGLSMYPMGSTCGAGTIAVDIGPSKLHCKPNEL